MSFIPLGTSLSNKARRFSNGSLLACDDGHRVGLVANGPVVQHFKNGNLPRRVVPHRQHWRGLSGLNFFDHLVRQSEDIGGDGAIGILRGG